jgi:CheY-like chemotaxis protein
LPLLLLVEDHEEVRQYVRESLGREYRMVECPDGEEGFRQAVRTVPDLVISDVMMPGLDGLELCRRLKNDPATSHIPVILLTGRADTGSRLDGLSTGADDYLTKPFHASELQLRVKNLLDNRQKWQERVRQRPRFDPGDAPLSPPDEAFLQRAYAVVARHFADPDFRSETFEDEMAMSKMQLYRKLKALTGQSPNEFVRATGSGRPPTASTPGRHGGRDRLRGGLQQPLLLLQVLPRTVRRIPVGVRSQGELEETGGREMGDRRRIGKKACAGMRYHLVAGREKGKMKMAEKGRVAVRVALLERRRGSPPRRRLGVGLLP